LTCPLLKGLQGRQIWKSLCTPLARGGIVIEVVQAVSGLLGRVVVEQGLWVASLLGTGTEKVTCLLQRCPVDRSASKAVQLQLVTMPVTSTDIFRVPNDQGIMARHRNPNAQ
jgi:hypothetical protein